MVITIILAIIALFYFLMFLELVFIMVKDYQVSFVFSTNLIINLIVQIHQLFVFVFIIIIAIFFFFIIIIFYDLIIIVILGCCHENLCFHPLLPYHQISKFHISHQKNPFASAMLLFNLLFILLYYILSLHLPISIKLSMF